MGSGFRRFFAGKTMYGCLSWLKAMGIFNFCALWENHKVYENGHSPVYLIVCKFYNLKKKQYAHKLKHHDNIAKVLSCRKILPIMTRQLKQRWPPFGISFMTQKHPPAAPATAQAPNSGGIGGQRYRLSRRCRGISYLSLTCPTRHWSLRLFFNGSKGSRQLF